MGPYFESLNNLANQLGELKALFCVGLFIDESVPPAYVCFADTKDQLALLNAITSYLSAQYGRPIDVLDVNRMSHFLASKGLTLDDYYSSK